MDDNKSSPRGRPLWIAAGAAILACILYAAAHWRSSSAPQSPAARAIQGALQLRNSMDPASFHLVQVLAMQNGAVCYLFKGQNVRAGSLNIETAFLDGESLHREGSPDFLVQWNHACMGDSRLVTDAVEAAVR